MAMPPPPLRASSSFMEMDAGSPVGMPQSLRTPHLSDGAQPEPHRRSWGSVGSVGGPSSLADSELSEAMTGHALRAPVRHRAEHDSPSLHRKAELPVATPRVPSCPQKSGKSADKPQEMREADDIVVLPRTLDLGDPVDQISLSPMNMSNGSPRAGPTAAQASRDRRPPPDVADARRPKRARQLSQLNPSMGSFSEGMPRMGSFSEASSGAGLGGGGLLLRMGSMSSGMPRMGSMSEVLPRMGSMSEVLPRMGSVSVDMPPPLANAEPPPLVHRNSMADTKMLFARKDARSCSFSEPNAFKFDEHFLWEGRLGSGSFSEVYAVRHKMRLQERYAIKRSKREFHSRKERAEYLKEVELANDMPPHENVVEYFRAWQDSYFFYVQMELCENGTLGNLIQREYQTLQLPYNEPRVWEMVLQIARGLGHIHGNDVIHCDIKPDNILISLDGTYKIGDLGQSTTLKAWDEHEGDACYLSRDLLESNPSTAADIFSFGIMMYEVKSGEQLPGSGDHWNLLRSGAVQCDPAVCGPALGQLIFSMMQPNPAARPSAPQILHACCNAQAQAAAEAAMAAAMAAAA